MSQHRDATELVLLHRRSPHATVIRPPRDSGVLAVVPGAPGDHADVLDIVAQAEGQDVAALCGRWWRPSPPAWRLTLRHRVEAFALHVYVGAAGGPVRDDPEQCSVGPVEAGLGVDPAEDSDLVA